MYPGSSSVDDFEENNKALSQKKKIVMLAKIDLFAECLMQAVGSRFQGHDIVCFSDPDNLLDGSLVDVTLIMLYRMPAKSFPAILRTIHEFHPKTSIGLVVENADENHLRTAGWAFPAYLLLMSLFTLPIALFGLTSMPAGSNPDMFVLTLPLAAGQDGLALLAFIGGFSSATSMIIVESIALSIMVSNHIVMPLVLRFTQGNGTVRGQGGVSSLLLNSRRFSIGLILGLGFLYFYFTRNSNALAPIGLISFCGVAQFLPAIIAALFGFGTVAGTSYTIAKVLFFLFLVLFVLSLIVGVVRRPPPV